MSCATCGDLPDRMEVRTGRDEYLPAVVETFETLAVQRGTPERRLICCPECHCVFDREEYPQFGGTGDCDDEFLTRLDAEDSRLLSDFARGALADPAPLLALPRPLMRLLLEHDARWKPERLATLLPAIAAVLPDRLEGGDHLLVSILERYLEGSPEAGRQVLAALAEIDEHPRLTALRDRCQQ